MELILNSFLPKIITMKKLTGISFAAFAFVTSISFKPKDHFPDEFVLVVDKSEHSMKVYEADTLVQEYTVVFGNDDMGDKMVQGDRKTPEGTFHISYMRKHNKWNKFMLLDYPTKVDYEKFNERKAKGLIPKNAKIGGDIGIHGTWPKDEDVIDNKRNWTLGCISLKNEDTDELYQNVVVGTKIIIKK